MASVLADNERNTQGTSDQPPNLNEPITQGNSDQPPNFNEPNPPAAAATVDGNIPDNNANQENRNGTNNPTRTFHLRRFMSPRAHLASVSERIVFSVFVKFAFAYGRGTSVAFRRLIEFAILFMAVTLLFLLIYMHRPFTHDSAGCLAPFKDSWAKDGILRVEVIKNPDPDYSLEHSYLKEELLHHRQMEYLGNFASPDFDLFFGNSESVDSQQHINKTDFVENSSEIEPERIMVNGTFENNHSETTASNGNEEDSEYSSTVNKIIVNKEKLEQIALAAMSEEYIIEYSHEYGFLQLSPATRKKLNISVKLVVLDPVKNDCFGDFIMKTVFDEVLGYDDVLMLSVKELAEAEENKAFLRNVVTGEHYKFINLWSGNGNYIAAAIVMMVFTLSVSMLLRYSHHQIFVFIVDLLQVLELNGSMTFPAAEMLTVILALVGMEAIMSEYFKDTSTAFYIIVLVWFSDQYDAICCHTLITKRHWLRFFYLYHFAFYSYNYRYNGQYSSLALITSAIFILHSMVYFFHHYELPKILLQMSLLQTGQIGTLNDIHLNVQHGVVPNEVAQADGGNTGWPGDPPGIGLRNTQEIRDETRLVNLMVRNINMADPVVVPNRIVRAHRDFFENIRNTIRNIQHVAIPAPDHRSQEVQPGVAPQSAPDGTDNSQEYEVGCTLTTIRNSEIANTSEARQTALEGSSGSVQTDMPETTNFSSSIDDASVEIRQRHMVDNHLIEGSRESSDQGLP